MRVLFVGSEGEYHESLEHGEDGLPFSLFFCMPPLTQDSLADCDAMIVPAMRYLSWPGYRQPLPLIASGPAHLASACFEAGCSDFIRSPWTNAELYARVFSRYGSKIDLGAGVTLEKNLLAGPSGRTVLSDDTRKVLILLLENSGHPVPRAAIASVIGVKAEAGRAIDMRIARLRAALRRAGAFELASRLNCGHGAYHFQA